jgi:hypothetical protein
MNAIGGGLKLFVFRYFIGMLHMPRTAQSHLRVCDALPSECLTCGLIMAAIEKSLPSREEPSTERQAG